MYKYTLIISQYYNSRHFFLVKFEDDFIERGIKLVDELEDYKRSDNEKERPKDYGDLTFGDNTKVRWRYNINDSGDIYFLSEVYANKAMSDATRYILDSYKESRRYVKKLIQESIAKHHDYKTVKSIVEKYFEIV